MWVQEISDLFPFFEQTEEKDLKKKDFNYDD